jgi:hypothetical protein
MKKLIFAITIILLQTGCSVVPKSEAIQAAVEREEYDGINKDSDFYVTVPSSHSGPYSSVDQMNFQIDNGKDIGRHTSAIMGKSRKTGEWEVLLLMTNKNGSWTELQKNK